MKTEIRNFLMGAGLTAMLWAPFLKAEESLAVVNVPFDFQVNQTLSAGTYTVIMESNAATIRRRNDNTGKSILMMPPGRDSNTAGAQLSFLFPVRNLPGTQSRLHHEQEQPMAQVPIENR